MFQFSWVVWIGAMIAFNVVHAHPDRRRTCPLAMPCAGRDLVFARRRPGNRRPCPAPAPRQWTSPTPGRASPAGSLQVKSLAAQSNAWPVNKFAPSAGARSSLGGLDRDGKARLAAIAVCTPAEATTAMRHRSPPGSSSKSTSACAAAARAQALPSLAVVV
jgi:hypothetical protein